MENVGKTLDLSLLDSLDIPGINSNNSVREVNSIEDFEDANNSAVESVEVDTEGSSDFADIPEEDYDAEDIVEEEEETGGSNDSAVKVWAEFASERGLIDLDEGEEIGDTEEFLVNKFNAKVEKVFQSYKDSLPETLKELLEAHEQGISIEDLLQSESRIAEYSSIDDNKLAEDTDLQKNIVKAFLRSQDFEEDEITEKLEKYEDALMLEGEAKSALKKLIKLEQREKEAYIKEAQHAEKTATEQYNQRIQSFTKSVMDKDEIIAGIPVTKEQKEEIVKLTTKPVAVAKNGMPITALKKMEMEDPDFLTKLAYVAGVLNWDLSVIERKAKTNVARTVKKDVDTYKDSKLGKLDLATIKKAVKLNQKQLFK
jgi:hypothetical protein